MKITILTIGSRGDVQPYVALGKGLQQAGFTVRLATHDTFAPLIHEAGLQLFPMGGNIQAITQGEAGRHLIEAGGNPVQSLRRLAAALDPVMAEGLRDSWWACQGADAVISSGTAYWGYDIAEHLGIPYFFAGLQPLFPTGSFLHPMAPPSLRLGGWANRATHEFFSWFYWRLFRDPINRWRRETLGQPPRYQCLFTSPHWCTVPKLFGYSPVVLPHPPDWPDTCHVTGYWFLDHPQDFQPPRALQDFLAAGPPPISIGFGSMTYRDPEQITELTLAALAKTHQRGILLTGWGGIDQGDLPDHVLKLESAPHDWLFPKMKAIVHHGGAGTTAAALRSGVPSVVVPFFADQPFWGRRLMDLGVSPSPIPKPRLSADRLANAIQKAIHLSPMPQRAEEIACKMQSEEGVTQAVNLIQRYLHKVGKR